MARFVTPGVVLLVLLAAPAAAQSTKTYRTAVFGFEFDYPASYLLKETAAPDGVPIFLLLREAAAGPREWVAEVTPEPMPRDAATLYGAEATATPLAFARHRATLMCDADGPGSSTSCPEIVRRTAFTSRGGLTGEVLYLREVHEEAVEDEDRTEVTERMRGPIYAFDISAGAASRIVIFTPASRGWDSPDALRALAEMASSLRRTAAPGVQ